MTQLALPDLMSALAAELTRLADTTEGLHDLVCAGATASERQFLRQAQRLDHTTQVLTELAAFCANLAADAPADCRVPAGSALSLLRLAELRARLSPGAEGNHGPVASDGALELF